MPQSEEIYNQSFSDPIICDVRVPVERKMWGKPTQPHQGCVSLDIKKANAVKAIIIASAFYQKIELPYRFTLTSGGIVYEKKHIKSVKISGAYLSGIDLINTQSQYSDWQTHCRLRPHLILTMKLL